jgi:hypothetical protein
MSGGCAGLGLVLVTFATYRVVCVV